MHGEIAHVDQLPADNKQNSRLIEGLKGLLPENIFFAVKPGFFQVS